MTRHRCDLVMKGGITSGVVFPRAIYELSKTYDFKNIAGTSAGAIAAVFAAAAQFGRNHTGVDNFKALGNLATWLGGKSTKTNRSNLLQLFQPTAETAPVFNFATTLISPAKGWRKILGAVRHIFFSSSRALFGALPGVAALLGVLYFGGQDASRATIPALQVFGLVLIASLLVFWILGKLRLPTNVKLGVTTLLLLGGWVAGARVERFEAADRFWILPEVLALALLLAGFLASGLAAFLRRLPEHLPDNFFGMCTGLQLSSGGGDPALTPWMHEQIQALAGRQLNDPVTFGDLERLDQPVNLKTMTSCLTHGRPYLIPFDQRDLFFDPREYERLFPPEVVAYLKKKGQEIVDNPDRSGRSKAMFRAMSPRLPLPVGEDLPILLAARMSLSFPFLLSAVPLWSFDWTDTRNSDASNAWQKWSGGKSAEVLAKVPDPKQHLAGAPSELHVPEVLWFSDGGLSSNFPVHLFDQMIPKWPTFAINLRYHDRKIADKERVEMVKGYSEGKNPVWSRMAEAGAVAPGGLGSFAGSLMNTMQNWVDNTQLTVPGYTDRIAHVNLGEGEGGLNLEMTPEQIEALAKRGELAALELRKRFHDEPGPEDTMTWDAHRWTRFRSTLGVLQTQLEKLQETYNDKGPESKHSWAELIERAKLESPYQWTHVGQAGLAETSLVTIARLLADIQAAEECGFNDGRVPKPRPEFRLRPPL